jgi:hypothetical protein
MLFDVDHGKRRRRRGHLALLTSILIFAVPLVAAAQDDDEEERLFNTKIYGVIDAYWEKVAQTPSGVDASGETEYESNPNEFDIPNLSLMVQGTIAERFSYFLTLAFPGASDLDVRSAWVQASIWGDYLNVRVGKLYRKFGLYNEILDAVPTYMGIEPPELFDKDHLLLTRTTNLMLHGSIQRNAHEIAYAVTTGNDETKKERVPVGVDLNYTWRGMLKVGTSFYSSNGNAAPSKSVGDGSPSGGVATWMEQDKYMVYGGYVQLDWKGLQLQTEIWQAAHDAKRDPEQVIKLMDAGLNSRQLRRFGLDGANPTEADVITDADYEVTTFYVRTGYTFELSFGAITPYVQYDFYRNLETIASKSYGGDNEAGLSDDGQFHKATAGVVFRPIPSVALKIDGSTHTQKFNGDFVTYPEIRASLSYLWRL